jgi:HJR/Mrr/RecB family endonuclease
MKDGPQADWTAYGAIIVVSITLCLAWLITGSIWLTTSITLLGLLYIAGEFPAVKAVIVDDPLLNGVRRAAPLIVIAMFGIILLINAVR